VSEEKAFEPTPARLARAKREGDVPRSRDIGAVASFVAALGTLVALGDTIAAAAVAALDAAARGRIAGGPYVTIAVDAGAIVASAGLGGVLAAVLQAGGIAFRFPQPNLAKLAPAPGLKRMFGREAAIGAGKAFVVAFAVGIAVVLGARDAVAGASAPSATALAGVAQRALGSAAFGATIVAAAFAIGDVLVERAAWRRRLKMSFEEIKREHKSSEGSPELRGRRRAAHRNLVRGSIASVKDAAFVVANPSHVAIALEYRPPAVAVPRVLVRATDDGARAVKARARSLGIPIVENVLLARALLASTVVGDPIPRDAYGAVALIVATLARAKAS
jgi:flagellar biosynthesis protein FlhB